MISALSTRIVLLQCNLRRVAVPSLSCTTSTNSWVIKQQQQLDNNQQKQQHQQNQQQQYHQLSQTQTQTRQQQEQKSFFHTTSCTHTTGTGAGSTQGTTSGYVFVDHSAAYLKALDGPHGKQLELATLLGEGKDDPDFDPFIEEEMEEDRLKAAAEAAAAGGGSSGTSEMSTKKSATTNDDDDDNEDDDEEEYDDDDDDEEDNDWRVLYNNDGSLKRSKSERTKLVAGAPAGGIFAIIELAGSQYKVTTDDVLIVNRLQPVSKFKVGSTHTLTGSQVLLVGTSHYTIVGMPSIPTAQVDVMVEEITQDAKVVVFSKRRRKNSKRRNGFRRDVTILRILDIRPPASYSNTYYTPRPEPTPPPRSAAILATTGSSTM